MKEKFYYRVEHFLLSPASIFQRLKKANPDFDELLFNIIIILVRSAFNLD